MAGAYSTDLRSRVLAAVEAGESPDAAARRFAMGRSTVYRWVRFLCSRTGQAMPTLPETNQ